MSNVLVAPHNVAAPIATAPGLGVAIDWERREALLAAPPHTATD